MAWPLMRFMWVSEAFLSSLKKLESGRDLLSFPATPDFDFIYILSFHQRNIILVSKIFLNTKECRVIFFKKNPNETSPCRSRVFNFLSSCVPLPILTSLHCTCLSAAAHRPPPLVTTTSDRPRRLRHCCQV